MANKYVKKEWIDRQSQYPNRVRMVETGIENVVDLERVEGEITEIGNAFDETNMNDLELRISNGFDNLDSSDIKVLNENNNFVSTRLEGVLNELFQYASNGKTAIANAIRGVSSSSTFAVLANAITTGKTAITTAIGTGTANNTFAEIAGFINTIKSNLATAIGGIATNSSFTTSISAITSGKTAIANAIGQTPGGTPTVNSTFAQMASLISIYKKNYVSLSLPSAYKSISATNGQTNSYRVSVNFGFTPSMIYVDRLGAIINGEIVVSSISKFARDVTNSTSFGIDNIDSSGFTIWIKAGSGESFSTVGYDTNMNVIAMG